MNTPMKGASIQTESEKIEAYVKTTRETYAMVLEAIAEGAALLPDRLLSKHSQLERMSPAPWTDLLTVIEETEERYRETIEDIAELAILKARLFGLLTRIDARKRPIDLSLPKKRRTP